MLECIALRNKIIDCSLKIILRRFLYRPDSAEYRRFRDLVMSLKQEQRGQFGNSAAVIKNEIDYEFGCGRADTDLRAELGGGGLGFRNTKAEPVDCGPPSDSEYGGTSEYEGPKHAHLNSAYGCKSEFGSDRTGNDRGRSEYGFVKSEPVSEYGGIKMEHGSDPENKSNLSEYGGFVKSEPISESEYGDQSEYGPDRGGLKEYGRKSMEQGFVYGGRMLEQKPDYEDNPRPQLDAAEYGAPLKEIKSEFGGCGDIDSRVKSEFGSRSEYAPEGGTKRERTIDEDEDERERRERKRRSRWGPQSGEVPPVGVVSASASVESGVTLL